MSDINIPPGFYDLYGEIVEQREFTEDRLREVFQQMGFVGIETPIFEYADVFNGHHGEGEDLLFRVKDLDGANLVARYDHTVPLSRFIASHRQELPMPYRRYVIGYSFRDERHLPVGKLRQFIQADGDIIGAHSPLNDAEVLNLAYKGMRALGVDDFVIRLNHRGIIQRLAEMLEIDPLVFQRAMDSADKQELIGNPLARIPILMKYGIDEDKINQLMAVISIDDLSCLDNLLGRTSEVEELRTIISLLPRSVAEKIHIDLNLARGADYYTGMILEGIIPGISVGAVLGGGRFDNMTQKFTNSGKVPAVGMAFGFDRLIIALTELGLFRDKSYLPKTILCYSQEDLLALSLVSEELRALGFEVLNVSGVDLQGSNFDDHVLRSNPTGVVNLDRRGISLRRQSINNDLLITYLSSKGINI